MVTIMILIVRKGFIGLGLLNIDDAFFQSDCAVACWGRWAGPGLMQGWSAGFGCCSSLQKEQERRRAGGGFARSRSNALVSFFLR